MRPLAPPIMAPLDSLGLEILTSIFEYVADSSAESALNFSLANRTCYASAKLVGYRYKSLSYRHDGNSAEVEGWLSNEDLLRGLRHLEVKSGREPSADLTPYDNLVTLIKRLGNLKTLTWSGGAMITSEILEALQKHHKNAKLGVYNFTRRDQTADENVPDEIALARSANLTAIKMSTLTNGEFPDLRRACFERIVANAPNLKFASISQASQGCVIHGITMEQEEEQAKLAEKFYTHRRPNASVRHLTLDGFGLDEQTLRQWGRVIDLSQLESIKCSRGWVDASYFTYTPQVLTNIKHLSLNLYGREDLAADVETYLTSCSPLKSISLWSWRKTLDLNTVLATHGPTIETLQLHEREAPTLMPPYSAGEERRQVVSVDEVKAIREACPKLQDLTIDCARHTQDLQTEIKCDQVLQVLSQMKLSKLQIYYDLGLPYLSDATARELRMGIEQATNQPLPDEDDDTDEALDGTDEADEAAEDESHDVAQSDHLPPSKPEQIRQFVSNLWEHIFGSRTCASRRLLEVKFGEWERKLGVGYPVRWALDEQDMKTRWVAKPHERDDRAGKCVVQRMD